MIEIDSEQDAKKKVKAYAYVKKEEKAGYVWAAEVLGVSLNQFIKEALKEKVQEVARTQFK